MKTHFAKSEEILHYTKPADKPRPNIPIKTFKNYNAKTIKEVF